MADSDEEYVQEMSDDGLGETGEVATRGVAGTSSYSTRQSRSRVPGQHGTHRTRERWEDIQRSWDLVHEGADGTLADAVEGLLEAGKRKRILRDTTPLQRGIIRHLILVIDMSASMTEKDLRPTRYLLSLRTAQDFVKEYFEQNPISQLGILGMREGLTRRVSDLSGNPNDHIVALQKMQSEEPKGNPSLQNALEMARGALFHTPSHGTREVLFIFGALMTLDPGDIHVTLRQIINDKIRVSMVGLAARMAICQEMCSKTNGVAEDSTSVYGVALDETHFRELLMAHTTPPTRRVTDDASAPSLLMMGFPSRIEEAGPTLCACHAIPSRGGYLCPRCTSKICKLPAQCPTCDLQLIQSTHLARSYHHLFPLRNYEEVSWAAARQKGSVQCFACLTSFAQLPSEEEIERKRQERPEHRLQKGASESSRYACTTCGEHFCIDCDVLAHEVVHNCAGCLCKPQRRDDLNGEVNGINGLGHGNEHQVERMNED